MTEPASESRTPEEWLNWARTHVTEALADLYHRVTGQESQPETEGTADVTQETSPGTADPGEPADSGDAGDAGDAGDQPV